MSAVPVYGYRLRFNAREGTGEIQLYLSDDAGRLTTESLGDLQAERFLAMAALLATDRDHKIHWDGSVLDAGPEKI